MKSLHFGRCAVSTGAAVALLAGCGGRGTQGADTLPAARAAIASAPRIAERQPKKRCGWLSSAAKTEHRLIYVASGNQIFIFPEQPHNPEAIGCISAPVDSTHGLYVDQQRNLYVTNGNNTVTVYPQGSLTPSTTYSSGLNGPTYPIVDPSGNLFVSNGNGTVVEYLSGQTTPYQTLHTPGYEADGLAFDASGNLYVTYRTAYLAGDIEEFAPGSSQGRKLGMHIVQPQGIVIASDGTIVVVETGRADGIYVFTKGSPAPELKLDVADTPVQLALTEREHKLFVSAFGWLGSGHIYAAPYPLTASSHFHEKIAFRLRHNGHRRFNRYQIQGMALGNGQSL